MNHSGRFDSPDRAVCLSVGRRWVIDRGEQRVCYHNNCDRFAVLLELSANALFPLAIKSLGDGCCGRINENTAKNAFRSEAQAQLVCPRTSDAQFREAVAGERQRRAGPRCGRRRVCVRRDCVQRQSRHQDPPAGGGV